MTPGNNGENTPSAPQGDDDPFGYLYEDGQAAGATPPGGGGGYGYPGPRSSYHHVRAVGDRRPAYGQAQAAQQTYGQQVPQQQPQQGGHGRPNPHYTAPEAQPGGAPVASPQYAPAGGGGGRGRGPNTKGLLIAAIAVVAVVAIGIGAAMLFGGKDEDKGGDTQTGGKPSQATSVEPSEKPAKKPKEKTELPQTDAKALKLEGGTTTASDVPGAKSAGGVYVAGLDKPGARVTWTVNGIPKDGAYTLFVGYGVPGEAAETTLTVNGSQSERKVNMDNFARAEKGAWDKGWTKTYVYVELSKGTNTLTVSCEEGDRCNANLDQFWLKAGHVTS
ncbi:MULTISPECIES: carbohydrate-binding protein [Streptomyces]|uniref:carbohydrate-binding protein n=1 Tax=Streptomyces TaxID=1883 RepID=UPI001E31E055|nr:MULTISPECIES: carbohydrate-binding protein [Streptomyces]UFQ16511.1 carbohydrate-binding protein [Streptomyces huasconensis]WCL86113.1 carbohydrate-binding protein [Streptomyces sp. JCM 35825]